MIVASVRFNAITVGFLIIEPAYRQRIVQVALQSYRPAQLTCRVHNPKHSH